MFDQKQLLQFAFILTVIGAINWGAQAMNQELVTKATGFLGLSPEFNKYIYSAVGVSGAVIAYYYYQNKIYISA